MKRGIILFFAFCLIAPDAKAVGSADWDVLFSMHTVRSLVRSGSDLWGATNAGLFRMNLDSEVFTTFTNAEGLSSNDIRAMCLDGRGNLILGMGNAYVDVFDLASFRVTRISDFKLNNKIFQINFLYNDGGTIYVATDIGVSRLKYYPELGGYLIEGSYTKLGDFPAETPVKTIQVFAGGLWVGTSVGAARGNLSLPHLESPTAWTNFTTAQGLSNNNILAAAVFRDTLYLAASDNLNRLNGDLFESLPLSGASNIAMLKVHEDTLYVGKSGGIYRYNNGSLERFGPLSAKGLALEFHQDGTMWAGMEIESSRLGGLRKFQNGDWQFYSPEGPRGEIISDILVEDNSDVWILGRQSNLFNNGGIFHFDGSHWVNLTRQLDIASAGSPVSPDSFFWYETRAIAPDFNGGFWVASDGRGLAWFEFNGDTLHAKAYYSAVSGRLFGIPGSPNYCVVRALLKDDWGNIWVCNSEADPTKGDPVAIIPADFIQDTTAFPNWFYLSPPVPQARYYVDRLAQDSFGRKWFGANNNTGHGIWILDDGGTPTSTQDDEWMNLHNLPSDSITALVCDKDGVMWVGTPSGVQYFYPAENMQALTGIDLYIPVGQSIRTIAVDPQNNKWFGTTTGVSVLGSDNFTWLHHYTSIDGAYPSGLPGDVVQAIAFDKISGAAYIGTDKGTARLFTPYKQMGAAIAKISAFPDPFIIHDGLNTRLQFDPTGLSADVRLKIFTMSGILVKTLSTTNEVNRGWDGRNHHGEFVGSGIYLLLAYDPNGGAKTSKVAVIKQ